MSAPGWTRVAAWALLPLTLAACARPVSCSLVGCSSGANVDLTSLVSKPDLWGSTARLCIGDLCEQAPVTGRADNVHLALVFPTEAPASIPSSGPVTVTLTLTKAGAVVLQATGATTLSRMAPNGEACGPICYSAELRLTGSTLVPVA